MCPLYEMNSPKMLQEIIRLQQKSILPAVTDRLCRIPAAEKTLIPNARDAFCIVNTIDAAAKERRISPRPRCNAYFLHRKVRSRLPCCMPIGTIYWDSMN